MNLKESSIPGNYVLNLQHKYHLEWKAEHSSKLYDILLASMSKFLSLKKSKEDGKVAIVFEDLKGEFKMAGVVTYVPNEDDSMPGNWVYDITFNKEDISDVTNVVSYLDTQFGMVVRDQANSLHGMRFYCSDYYQEMLLESIDTLKEFLDVNAKEGEVVEVELPGYFVASVAIENGEKVMSIVPDGPMKQMIKSDSALSKN